MVDRLNEWMALGDGLEASLATGRTLLLEARQGICVCLCCCAKHGP